MHILIGLAILVGLIAFAFGEDVARNIVGAGLLLIAMAVLGAATFIIIEVLR